MTEQDIIILWRRGINKEKLAELYKRSYNNHIKLMRSNIRDRNTGKFITNYEALKVVERVIYINIMKNKNNN